jgi:hypothetical protein
MAFGATLLALQPDEEAQEQRQQNLDALQRHKL